MQSSGCFNKYWTSIRWSQNSSLHSINMLYISSTYPDENLGPFSFQKNKTGAINPPSIEKRVKSGKELTGSFKFLQDWKFSPLDGVLRGQRIVRTLKFFLYIVKQVYRKIPHVLKQTDQDEVMKDSLSIPQRLRNVSRPRVRGW